MQTYRFQIIRLHDKLDLQVGICKAHRAFSNKFSINSNRGKPTSLELFEADI